MYSINRTRCLASHPLKLCNTVTFTLTSPWKNANFATIVLPKGINGANVFFFHTLERTQLLCRSASQGQVMFEIAVPTRKYRIWQRVSSKQNLPPICSEIGEPAVIQQVRDRYCLVLVLEGGQLPIYTENLQHNLVE